MPGHSFKNMKFTVIEQIKKEDIFYKQPTEIFFTIFFIAATNIVFFFLRVLFECFSSNLTFDGC